MDMLLLPLKALLEDFKMKWRGQRQSTNVEDRTLDPLPDIPDGTQLVQGYTWKKTPAGDKNRLQENANRDVARRGNNVPTPTPRPDNSKTHDNLVTPGKWKTKSK